MLDLARLKRVKLSAKPRGQVLMANMVLLPNFRMPRSTEIALEGLENLPGGPVMFAMNHTDRYNYWPFQFKMYKGGHGFAATWVKGKYYENGFVGWFMDHCNNIPLPSRGYVISTEFRAKTGRVPSRDEYRLLRDIVNGSCAVGGPYPDDTSRDLQGFLATGDFDREFELLFNQMMTEVVRLCRLAHQELGQHLLVFPQGTRSKRLTRGHTGLVQMAQHLGATIVPVGCNGSDLVYPGNSPFAKGGKIVYRIGAPITVDAPAISAARVPEDALPFSRGAAAYSEQYQSITDVVMDRINDLLDPEYQRQVGVEAESEAVSRFIE
ncbi:MAG: 1-acyl-sn-glycerol-3-phosphate acyltransferase [Myxococcota bacterium]|jgi:1-acyl-sn-glycerol-3-phosphate acyltransferase